MPDRLISADALKKLIANHVYPVADAFNNRDNGMFWTGGIEKAIDEVPTVDVESLIAKHEDIGYEKGYRDGYAKALEETDNVPDKKVGKWIDAWRSAWDGTRHWYRECSECGYERDDDNIDKDTKFCPNCGAYMGVEDDNNN